MAKNRAAVELGRRGGKKGGRARAAVLSDEERKDIAKKAAAARWGKEVEPDEAPVVIVPEAAPEGGLPYSQFPGSLDLAGMAIDCHVLSDGRRVISQREMVRLLSAGRESGNLQRYLERIPKEVGTLELGLSFVEFRVPGTGLLSHGFEAKALIDLCSLYDEANHLGVLHPRQRPLARQAAMVLRACAKVGIEALIDEATGYQQFRAKNALQLKLKAFIAEEMQAWVKTFPDEFWVQLARLEGVRYSPRLRPMRWGKYVMAFVYDAMDKDVGDKLREINKNPSKGHNHHQWLQSYGKDELNRQLWQVITVMKLCDNMDDFKKKFAHVFKKAPLQTSLFDLL